jgi:anti-sigma regulatory factor (Ser/Thr protein kinase)
MVEEKVSPGSLELIAERDNFYQFISFIENYIAKIGIQKEDATNILLASEEIIINIINYAYENEKGTIKIDLSNDKSRIKLNFTDYGKPFNLLKINETDISLPLEKRGEGGYGILIVKKIMDSVHYEYRNGKNVLTVTKHINN